MLIEYKILGVRLILVFIKRITVKDFKSFHGTIKLNFQHGFNIITGPNGSGKSNIIDAVQFVFGELGSKRMRVPDLSGLIYDGAEQDSLKPKYSQVTIHLDNTDRGLAIDKKTVSIARRVDQKNKSKYLLNGKPSSRRAIIDLLEMAGITPGGYNIVLQGTATRLSDLTPSERMTALESLIGIAEYDVKKAEAKIKLNEAERKIEIAAARIDEVRKRVNELERQRNDAIRYNLLLKNENQLEALKLSTQIIGLKSRIIETEVKISDNEREISILEKDREILEVKKNEASEHFEIFTKESAEKGNTRLPLLNSELVGKRTLLNSLKSSLVQIDQRKKIAKSNIDEKHNEITKYKVEIEEKKKNLKELIKNDTKIGIEIQDKEAKLREFSNRIINQKESAEANHIRVEKLTESLIPMQESLSGLEIEINKHHVNMNSYQEKNEELELKKRESTQAIGSLNSKIEQLQYLKLNEAKKLEEMLKTIEDQVKRQKNIRNTLESANILAKEADVSITQFNAKRDLWKKINTNEDAQARIKEMGEAGALKGYHGSLRSLIKIDLKYQRAVRPASNGWIDAIVVDDIKTAVECVERLKKTRLGRTRFIPLRDINPPEPLPDINRPGIVGYIPDLLRYDEKYAPAVNLVWGDTFIVENRNVALNCSKDGYRTVTLSGDVFEVNGGLIGGHYRRPPDFSKIMPSEDSINNLSQTIKTLRVRLKNRMSDLKLSGNNLRKFTGQIDHYNKNIEEIDQRIYETKESIEGLKRKISTINENIAKISKEKEREKALISTLQERKEKTLQEIDRTKNEIVELKKYSLPSDVIGLELLHEALTQELQKLQNEKAQLKSDISVQTNLIEHYLHLKTEDSEAQIENWKEELVSLDVEQSEIRYNIEDITSKVNELEKDYKKVTSDVEATSKILEKHRRSLRQLILQIEKIDQKHINFSKKSMELKVELEKLRFQLEQKYEILKEMGFKDIVSTRDVDLNNIEHVLYKIKREKSYLGAINQLAISHYEEVVVNYKYLSIRINELEEERASILNFIEEVEKEKQDHFMKAFNEVCENFSNIFSKITGGGDGRLELQNPEDPFSGGVDLYIQFPGKPMRLASGASGGERSVAAITYLLAIQRFLKAPFYLFDEIDAHLDDLNTSRLADVLKESSLEAQFLMVSLKDVMVHNADKIYGVFSQQGRSRVLSLPMRVEVTA
jgi:chromosome segregation protein